MKRVRQQTKGMVHRLNTQIVSIEDLWRLSKYMLGKKKNNVNNAPRLSRTEVRSPLKKLSFVRVLG